MPDIVRRNFRQYDRDLGQTGIYAPSGTTPGLAATTLVATRGYVMRFRPSRAMTITSIAFAVSTAASVDDPVDVGIYDATLATKLVSSGATSGKLNSTGTKAITVTATTLSANTTYYGALSCGTIGGTAANISGVTYSSTTYLSLFGAAAPQVEGDAKAAVHPLPSAWGALGVTASGLALLAIRES